MALALVPVLMWKWSWKPRKLGIVAACPWSQALRARLVVHIQKVCLQNLLTDWHSSLGKEQRSEEYSCIARSTGHGLEGTEIFPYNRGSSQLFEAHDQDDIE